MSLTPDDALRGTILVNNPDEDGCADRGDGKPGACPMRAVMDDRTPKDGPAVETVIVTEACDKTFAVTVSEKNSVGFLYDVSDIISPVLQKVFHLSSASETLNPGLACDARTLGEVDLESIHFLKAQRLPR